MSNHSLKPLTPLGHAEPQLLTIGTVTIQEVVGFSLASIAQRHGQKVAFEKAAGKAFGVPLAEAGRSEHSKNKTLIWTGPDQWLFEAPNDTHEDIAADLSAIFKQSASVTEQTGGWCRFDLDGDQTVPLLQRICALDTATMDKGRASRSIMEHIGVFVLCQEPNQTFCVYGPRSSAASLFHALTTAAKSIE